MDFLYCCEMIASLEGQKWSRIQEYFLSFYFLIFRFPSSLKCQGARGRECVKKCDYSWNSEDDLILDCCQFYSLPMSIGTPRMLKWIIIGSCLSSTNLFLTFPGLWCSCLRSSMGISRLVVVGAVFTCRLAERLLRFRSIPPLWSWAGLVFFSPLCSSFYDISFSIDDDASGSKDRNPLFIDAICIN